MKYGEFSVFSGLSEFLKLKIESLPIMVRVDFSQSLFILKRIISPD